MPSGPSSTTSLRAACESSTEKEPRNSPDSQGFLIPPFCLSGSHVPAEVPSAHSVPTAHARRCYPSRFALEDPIHCPASFPFLLRCIHSRPSLLVVLLQTSLRTTPGFFINTGCCSTLSFPNLPLPFLAALLRISSATYIPTSIALLSRTVVGNCPHHGLPGLREAVPGGADRDETAICEARIWPEGKEALQSILVVAFDYFLRHFPDRCAVPVSRKHSMRKVT
jgi:hypothetical protein